MKILIITALFVFLLPFICQAAPLTNMSDTMTRLKVGETADHTLRWTLPTGVQFNAGDKARVVFPAAFETSASGWAIGDFTFNDGTARTIDSVAIGADPTCNPGANNVGIRINSATDEFIIIACPSYTASNSGAAVTFEIKGTSPNGTLTNPSSAASYKVDLVGDDKGNGWGADDDTGSFPVAIITNEQVTVTASVPSAPLPPLPPGGGWLPSPSETRVIFVGRAYPKSTVTLLKDAQIAATTIAGSDANFQISLTDLSAGNYIFSGYSEDKEGRRSNLLTFPVSVTFGVTTTISGIFIAPTIDVDKIEVKRGDNIAIFGQSVPKADIIISVNSKEEFFAKTISDKDGIYLYYFNTIPLEMGQHFTKSRASIGNLDVSGFSHAISFIVGTRTILKEKKPEISKGDLNNDKRVNLVDFSIAAYWYKRPNPPANVDLNSDGKVDLVDFSIMVYYWTG